MDILVHADGFRMSDELKASVEEKIGRLEQLEPRAVRARVHLRRVSSHHNDKEFQAKVLIEMPGRDVSAEKEASQPLEAVDLLYDVVDNILRKRKDDRTHKRAKETDQPLGVPV
jgi:ribosomal subunit interface protein